MPEGLHSHGEQGRVCTGRQPRPRPVLGPSREAGRVRTQGLYATSTRKPACPATQSPGASAAFPLPLTRLCHPQLGKQGFNLFRIINSFKICPGSSFSPGSPCASLPLPHLTLSHFLLWGQTHAQGADLWPQAPHVLGVWAAPGAEDERPMAAAG